MRVLRSSPAAILLRTAVLGGWALLPAPAAAERLRVVLEGVRGVGAGARIVAQAQHGPARVVAPVEHDSAALDLPAGAWTVRLEAAGYWAPAKTLPATEREGPEVDFALPAWRTGELRVPKPPEGPAELRAAFARPPQASEIGLNGWLACVPHAAHFACELPAAVLDVELRAPGFVPTYCWDLQVPAGESLAVPAPWRRGASLAGFVRLDDGAACAGCAVTARDHYQDTTGGAPRLHEAQTNARGFFQIIGLPPGGYLLRASSGGLASGPEWERLAAGSEARLATPLVVRPPQPLEVRLIPGRDPYGRPWYLSVTAGLEEAAPLVRELPLEEGRWRHAGLPLDTYTLSIGDSRGGLWRTLRKDLRAASSLDVDLPSVPVTGRLTLGQRPLSGRLVFSLADERLVFESDAAGRYSGFLPDRHWRGPNTEWEVFVRAPRVARTLTLLIGPPPSGTSAVADVGLPATRLRGRVLEELGAPLSAGLRLVLAQERPWTQRGDQRALKLPLEPADAAERPGEFVLDGLEPGTHLLAAETERQASEPVRVQVLASGETHAAPLMLREVVRVRLRVVDRDGPVGGARVLATPIGASVGTTRRHISSDDGTLELNLPDDTLELGLLVADGGSFRLLRTKVRHGQSLTLRMPEAAARLRLRAPGLGELPSPGGARAFLLVAGFAAEVEALRQLGLVRPTDAAGAELLLSGAAPGPYELCWLTPAGAEQAWQGAARPAGCAEGQALADSELSLTLPVRR